MGKDHGDGASSSRTPFDRHRDVAQWYREYVNLTAHNRPWNPHYRGTVRIDAELSQLACAATCNRSCAGKRPAECALEHFAQANAVKCVETEKTNRQFEGQRLVQRCLSFLVEEIRILRPQLLVLQSSEQSFVRLFRVVVASVGTFGGVAGPFESVAWPWNESTIVWFNRHPARISYDRYIEEWVAPHMATALQLLRTMPRS